MGDWPPGKAEAKRAFAERLRGFREAASLTQIELAGMANVDRTFVTKLETGASSPTLWTIARMAWALGLDTADLVGGIRPSADYPTRPAPAKSRRKMEA